MFPVETVLQIWVVVDGWCLEINCGGKDHRGWLTRVAERYGDNSNPRECQSQGNKGSFQHSGGITRQIRPDLGQIFA